MIVDTMTLKEVGNSLLKEYREYHVKRIIGLLVHKHKAYRRTILANGEKRINFKPFSYTYQSTEIFIMPFSIGKKDFKKYSLSYYAVARFFYKGEYWYAKFNFSTNFIELYKQHFFQRYIERHLKSDDKVGIDIVCQFMIDTEAVAFIRYVKNEKHKNCIYGSTSIGMCLGECFGGINVWKTYIDKETIEYGIKKEIFDAGSEIIKPIGIDEFGYKKFRCVAA